MAVQKDYSYYVRGNRVGVLLIHGLAGTPAEMRYVANGVARAGYTVYCPQLAGHGGTEDEIKTTTWQDWYASVERSLFELRKDCETVIVGGLSTGALLALLLAARNPEHVHGTALFAPTFWLNGWQIPWYMNFFRLVSIKRIANRFNFPDHEPHGIKDDRVREFVRAAMLGPGKTSTMATLTTPGGAVIEHRWLAKVVRKELHKIHQPTLILHPREDDLADLNNAWHLERHLGGFVNTVVLDDSYHIVTIDRQRHVVVERVTAFVENVSKRARERASTAKAEGMEEAPQTITVKPVSH
jgi:carboxylesterase